MADNLSAARDALLASIQGGPTLMDVGSSTLSALSTPGLSYDQAMQARRQDQMGRAQAVYNVMRDEEEMKVARMNAAIEQAKARSENYAAALDMYTEGLSGPQRGQFGVRLMQAMDEAGEGADAMVVGSQVAQELGLEPPKKYTPVGLEGGGVMAFDTTDPDASRITREPRLDGPKEYAPNVKIFINDETGDREVVNINDVEKTNALLNSGYREDKQGPPKMVPTPSDKANEKLLETQATKGLEAVEKLRTAGSQSTRILPRISGALKILETVDTGATTPTIGALQGVAKEFGMDLGPMLEQFGLQGKSANDVASTEMLNSILQRMVIDTMTGTEGASRMFDTEREQQRLRESIGSMNLDNETLRALLETRRREAQFDIGIAQAYDTAYEQAQANGLAPFEAQQRALKAAREFERDNAPAMSLPKPVKIGLIEDPSRVDLGNMDYIEHANLRVLTDAIKSADDVYLNSLPPEVQEALKRRVRGM